MLLIGNTVVTAAVVETQKNSKLRKNTLKLNFKFDSLTVVLYSSNEDKVMPSLLHMYKHTQVITTS